MAIKHLDKNLNRIQQRNEKIDLTIYCHNTLLGMELGARRCWRTNITCDALQQNDMQIGLPGGGIFYQ